MPVVRTVVTALPRTTTSDSTAADHSPTAKTYRIDPGPTAPIAKPTAALGASILGVDVAQLLADLEAESRRLIGPSAPPSRG